MAMGARCSSSSLKQQTGGKFELLEFEFELRLELELERELEPELALDFENEPIPFWLKLTHIQSLLWASKPQSLFKAVEYAQSCVSTASNADMDDAQHGTVAGIQIAARFNSKAVVADGK